jgi:mannosylglucosylglycerate synthase
MHDGYPWSLLRSPWPGTRQVVVSKARQEELAELFGISLETIRVVPAGLDMQDFLTLSPHLAALIERLGLSKHAPILLSPVRITRRKNLEQALAMLAVLRQDLPDAALIITGPPGAHNPANAEYFEQLRKMRRDLDLEGAAFLMADYAPDGLPESEVAALYRLADALFLPSREEGFGIPILEAGLAGLPVFCTGLASLSALAGDSAVYFSPDDLPMKVAALVRARLAADPVYQLRARVRLNYTWEAVYRREIAPLLEGA